MLSDDHGQPKIIKMGYPKSGHLWLYQILRNILELSEGWQYRSYYEANPVMAAIRARKKSHYNLYDEIEVEEGRCFVIGPSRSHEVIIDNLEDYLSHVSLVWSHSLVNDGNIAIFGRFPKVLYLVRDPRDVLVSMAYWVTRRDDVAAREVLLQRMDEWLVGWVRNLSGMLLYANRLSPHFVFYEGLHSSFDNQYDDLTSYLGFDDPASIREKVRERTTFEYMKRQSPDPLHVRKGRQGGWVEMLDETQLERVVQIAGSLMELFGYPLERPLSTGQVPLLQGDPVAAGEEAERLLQQRDGALMDKLLDRIESRPIESLAIYGAGRTGVCIKRRLEALGYQVAYFIDGNPLRPPWRRPPRGNPAPTRKRPDGGRKAGAGRARWRSAARRRRPWRGPPRVDTDR